MQFRFLRKPFLGQRRIWIGEAGYGEEETSAMDDVFASPDMARGEDMCTMPSEKAAAF